MAGKAHVDNSVNERRLRPIYDWLDNGSNKRALQECEKVLKKQPTFLCARVLKALALLRLGKPDESNAILAEVQAEAPTDDSTLQAMTICYREINAPEKICDLYEAAVKKDPSNEDLLSHLFVACVRVSDYRRQQQVALNLYKVKPKNPYYFWAVMSVVMQASQADQKVASSVVLPLAERMVCKFIDDAKIEAEQEVLLYLMILEMQGKYIEALAVLDGPLAEKLNSPSSVTSNRKASLLAKLERWNDLLPLYRQLIRENPDQWNYYVEYFKIALHHVNAAVIDEEEKKNSKSSVADSVSLVEELCSIESQKASKKLRGPYLARLELYRLLLEGGDTSNLERLGNIVTLMEDYFREFGSKPTCFGDLKTYITMLTPEQCSTVLDLFQKIVGLDQHSSPETVNQLYQHLSYMQLLQYSGKHESLSAEEKIALARDLLRHFGAAEHFGEGMLPTDFRPGDPYAQMAVHFIYDAWKETKKSSLLKEAMIMLEHGIQLSPSNFCLKLLLLKLYNLAGAVGPAMQVHDSLDIKHMQLDSLGYLQCRYIACLGHLSTAEGVFSSTLRFFTSSHKDIVDHIVAAYKFGSFAKVDEFIRFRNRLHNSLHFSLVTAEKMLADLLMDASSHSHTLLVASSMEIDPEKDETVWDDLTDNRDYALVKSWSPPRDEEKEAKQAFELDVRFLQLRNLTLRCLAASVALSEHPGGPKNVGNGQTESNGVVPGTKLAVTMAELCKEMEKKLADARESRSKAMTEIPLEKYVLQSPYPSRLLLYVENTYAEATLASFHLFLTVHKTASEWNEAEEGSGDAAVVTKLNDLSRIVSHMCSEQCALLPEDDLQRIEDLSFRCQFLEQMFNAIEVIGITAVVLGCCKPLLKQSRTQATTRKGKRKKGCDGLNSSSVPMVFDQFNSVLTELTKCSEELCVSLTRLPSAAAVNDLTAAVETVHIAGDAKKESLGLLARRLLDSYTTSCKELGQVLQNKAKYLKSLKL